MVMLQSEATYGSPTLTKPTRSMPRGCVSIYMTYERSNLTLEYVKNGYHGILNMIMLIFMVMLQSEATYGSPILTKPTPSMSRGCASIYMAY